MHRSTKAVAWGTASYRDGAGSVSKDFQRLGIAKQMMKRIAEHFSHRGMEIVQVSTEGDNKIATAAYNRIGFKQFAILRNGLKYDETHSDEVMMSVAIGKLINH